MKTTRSKVLSVVLVLAMLLSILPMGGIASASVPTYNGVELQFGDPNYLATPPESLMTITGSGTSYTANYTGTDSAYFYPDTLSLYVYYPSSPTTISLTAGGGVQFATYSGGVETLHSTLTPSTNVNEGVTSDLYTVKLTTAGTVTVKNGSTTLVTLSFSAPKDSYPSAGGATPNALMGYLPLGQFATGSGWGSPYSDGTSAAGSTPKIVGAYSSTGVSLGAAGGYVQYSFASPIPNSAANPYGVDFIVYGNAFNGNPEAGSVKVSQDGSTWYDLAGSLYYDAKTIRNADITYTLSGTNILYTITAPQLSSAITGTFKASGTAWFPTSANYGGVWKIGSANVGASSFTSTSVTYEDVTLVKDTDTTNDYQFGYADVHINGSSYGTAVNPYTITNTASGGDGFDISWAVDANGQPVNLASIQYVRVYTAAAMNSAGTAMTVPSIFGETSTEVCGIYAASGTGSGAAAKDLVVRNGATNILGINNMGTKSMPLSAGSFTFNVYSGADSVHVNGIKVSCTTSTPYAHTFSISAGEVKDIQIITQTGTASPFVTLIKVTGT